MNTSKPKPDLMAASSTASGGGKRILAQLEHGPKPAAKAAQGWTIDGWTVGLILLLLLMCTTAWLMHDETITPATFKHSDSSARPTPTLHQDSAPSTAPEVEPSAQAAAIVNAPAAEPVVAAAVETAPVSYLPSAHAATATVPVSATPVTPSRAIAVTHKPNNASASVAARPSPAAQSAQAAATSTADTDVTLLTALVAHANKPAVAVPERSRDVVERQEGDTTTQLLARCKQLGLIEGMLCRSRICSGRWESDAACRAPAH